MPLGQRLRIRFVSHKRNGTQENNGYWYLRPIDPDDESKGWRLTYKIQSAVGEEITCGQPIEGYDPVQAIEMLLGFIHQEIIDTHKDIIKRVEFYHTFRPQDQLVVVQPPYTMGELLSKDIRCWHLVVPDLVKEYHRIRESVPARGWPLVAGDPFPWEADPSLIPTRSAEFKAVWDVRNKNRKQKRKRR